MQINGVSEFLSKFTTLPSVTGGRRNSMPSFSPLPKNVSNSDTVTISDAGKRLSVGTKSEDITQLEDDTKADTKTYSGAMTILEKMYELAVTAQDESLTDLERVDMQIEFENLREDLHNNKYTTTDEHEHWLMGNDSSVLERMRERIVNGQEWDVREVFFPLGVNRFTYNDNGEVIQEFFEPGWHELDDSSLDYSKVQTVREYIEASTPVVLMDAESAVKGAEYLKSKMSYIQKHGMQNPDELPGRKTIWYANSLLNDPTDAVFFGNFISFDGETVTDTMTHKAERLAEVDESYPEAEHGAEKNSTANKGYVLDVLSEEEVVGLIKNHEIVYYRAAGTHPQDFINSPLRDSAAYNELRESQTIIR